MNRQRRLAGFVIMAVGVAFVGVALANRLFSVGPAFDDMTVGFRGQMQAANITQLRQDLAAMDAVSEEFSTKVAPAMAQALGMTAQGFSEFMGTRFPAVATGVAALPQIGPQFGAVVDTLDAERTRFASADAIPTTSLPATTVPWAIVIAGIAAVILGAMLLRPGSAAPVLALILGALLIVGPIFLALPRKASHADTMNDHLKPLYTAQLVTQAKGALTTIGAMGTQMQQEMLPAIGTQLGMSAEQLSAFLDAQFPVLSAAMTELPAMLGRFTATVGVFDENLGNYDTIKSVSFVPIVWALIIGGAVVLLFGAMSFTPAQTEDHTPAVGIGHRTAA